MRTTKMNHTSIVANSLDESARFYEELFGMERIPTAKFPDPVLWLRARYDHSCTCSRADEDTPSPRPHVVVRRGPTSTRLYARAKQMGILDVPCVRLAAP